MNVVDISVKTLLNVFPETWPERLQGLNYSEAKLAELKPRFEDNWIKQTNLHLDLSDEQLTALAVLAETVWANEALRIFSLMTSHFLFNAGDKELKAFTWSTDMLEQAGLTNGGLFYLLSYLTHIDAAIQVYREQRIPLDLYAQTASRIKSGISVDFEGRFRYSDYGYLGWLCEGKLINLNGILYLPSRWEDNYSIWRNGLTGELHEEEIADGQASDQMNLAAAAKERGLDLNLWQLKLKPGDKILAILDMNQELQADDINYSLVLADRFYKDPDHFHNFVAFDFRVCQHSANDRNLTVALREEL